MAKDQVTTVKDAVHKMQLALLEGIEDQNQLFAAGSLMSRGDYDDVVTERTIAGVCGYPPCGNPLPSERPWKGRYRISLKEHKVYDLQETYMYCCTNCVINSRTFAASLPAERCSVFNSARINEILRLFKNQSFEITGEEAMGRNVDLGLSKLKIQEKIETKSGEVSLEDWIGPSNAIEGYVPRRDQNVPLPSKAYKNDSEPNDAKLNKADSVATEVRGFESAILSGDGCAPSKALPGKNDESFELLPAQTTKCLPSKKEYKSTITTEDTYDGRRKPLQNRDACGNLELNKSKEGHKPKRSNQKKEKDANLFSMDFMSTIITQDEYSVSKPPSGGLGDGSSQTFKGSDGKASHKDAGDRSVLLNNSSTSTQIDPKMNLMDSKTVQKHTSSGEKIRLATPSVVSDQSHDGPEEIPCVSTTMPHSGKTVESSKTVIRSSLKSSNVKKGGRTVTWADENKTGSGGKDLCKVKEIQSTEEISETLGSTEVGEHDSPRLASAQACAIALSQAAESVASGQYDVADAVSEAGVLLLPQEPDANENKHADEVDTVESEQAPLKWPKKSDISNTNVLDSADSWFDLPPEGFSLTLSPFATMWDALFAWMTCSSLAYIYGKDDSLHEEYLFANGREYPRKILLSDGRSSEIKQTMAGCLARALPNVIADLKLGTPISTLEQGLACLLETMSFTEALPSFRVKQWQVTVLLLIEALAICRVPALAPHLTCKRTLIPKVLDGAHMSLEEYNFLKDIILPLGREA